MGAFAGQVGTDDGGQWGTTAAGDQDKQRLVLPVLLCKVQHGQGSPSHAVFSTLCGPGFEGGVHVPGALEARHAAQEVELVEKLGGSFWKPQPRGQGSTSVFSVIRCSCSICCSLARVTTVLLYSYSSN